MDAKRLEYFKQKLLEKQALINQVLQKIEGYARERDQSILDLGDMAVESYTKELIFGKSSGDRQTLQLIQEALDRIEEGTYGICTNCEQPIQPKRLEAVPWTRLCIQCQDLLEKGLLDQQP